jgi:type IV secretory pathway protease TraF
MLERGYLNHNQPLLKTISAKKGDHVCIIDNKLYINQQFRGHVPLKDSNQRRLMPTKLCRKLIKGEFFVTGSGSYRSFDSRYFGVIHTEQIQAEAELLWQN